MSYSFSELLHLRWSDSSKGLPSITISLVGDIREMKLELQAKLVRQKQGSSSTTDPLRKPGPRGQWESRDRAGKRRRQGAPEDSQHSPPRAAQSLGRQCPPQASYQGGSDGSEAACNAGDPDSIPGSGRSPGEGNGIPVQNPCLKNPTNRGAWWATVHGAPKSWTRLSS